MNLAEVQSIASLGESVCIELKKSTSQLESVGKVLCGFLNASGGQVFIGVTPGGRVSGQDVSDSTQRKIAATLQKFQPSAPISIERVPLDSKRQVIVLTASPDPDGKPYVFDGRPFQRVGTTTPAMPQETYRRWLLERYPSQGRWENRLAAGIALKDLDADEMLRTVRLGIEAGRLPESSGTDIGEILDRLGLRVGHRLRNAAVVLFGTGMEADYPQCLLRMARFKGIDKSVFIDNRQAHGHAFYLLEEAMSFMRRQLPISGRFESGRLERIDEPLFPVKALREAVINAVCHRTYTHAGGSISVGIYDDRLEIWSDGTLPFNLTPASLKRKHESRPRNPRIANVFFRRGLIEQWGRGTQDIVEMCVRAGHPEPEFSERAGFFGVRFVPNHYIGPPPIDYHLTDRQREILAIVGSRRVHLREIISRLKNVPATVTVRRDLYQLKRHGLIDFVGYGRSAAWYRTPSRSNS